MSSITINGTAYELPLDDTVASKVPSYNAAIIAFAADTEAVTGGLNSKNLGGATTAQTLTSTEARKIRHVFTNAGAALDVKFPLASTAKFFVVKNSSGFALTIKTDAVGSTGIAVGNGKIRALFINGNNVEAAGPESDVSGSGGSGDVVGPASSVDSEIALFSGTSGKLLKSITGNGILKVTSGVVSGVTEPSGALVGTTATQTLTAKRVTPRTGTEASSATPTINTDNVDMFTITALATAITSMTTNLSGTPTEGQKLLIRILDDGTGRAITWGASFVARGVALPTTTVASKYLYVGFIWNAVASKWDCIASGQEA